MIGWLSSAAPGVSVVDMLTRVLLGIAIACSSTAVIVAPAEAFADSAIDRRGEKSERNEKKADRRSRAVPEINAQHAGAAVALVAGGIAVALGRRRREGNA
jgi:hypothetical protein